MNAPNPVLVGLFLADVLDWLAEQEEVVDGSLLTVGGGGRGCFMTLF